jgi:hypothetical protein
MTLPAAEFADVRPPADGLRLAFGVARRRRHHKAAVGMVVGAAVLATALALTPSAGRTVLQQPVQPAGHSGGPSLPGIDAPEPYRGSTIPAGEAAPLKATVSALSRGRVAAAAPTPGVPASSSCGQARRDHLLCAGLRANTAGRTTVNVHACAPRSMAVAVSRSREQDVQVATGNCVLPRWPRTIRH